jgi:membrane protease YdiL (CAAX protease family)
MTSETIISILLVLAASTMLVITGLKKQPGLGVIGTMILIGLAYWLRGDPLSALGFALPENWLLTVLLGLALGTLIQFLSIALLEPVSEKLTRSTHDQSLVADVKGNWIALLQWLLVVWIFVGFLEEGVYRGFLMTETARVIGTAPGALVFSILFSSTVFGFSHGYQNKAGILSTGVIGALLALIFVLSDFNLWLAIFTHGFIDTAALVLLATDREKAIRRIFQKKDQHTMENSV